MPLQPCVLSLVLHHAGGGLLSLSDVCAVLCVSRHAADGLGPSVQHSLTARLQPATLPEGEAQCRWLRKHGRLLRSLQWQPCLPGGADAPPVAAQPDVDADRVAAQLLQDTQALNNRMGSAESGNAAATRLLAAVARQGSLSRLESFTCTGWDEGVPELLQALPAGLPALQLQCSVVHDSSSSATPALCSGWRATMGGLAHLTGLRGLQLTVQPPFEKDHRTASLLLAEALGGMQQLTELTLEGLFLCTECTPSLPPSLRRLMVTDTLHCIDAGTPQLAHLTSLTELHLGDMALGGSSDPPALPPALEVLHGEGHDLAAVARQAPELSRLTSPYFAEELALLAPAVPAPGARAVPRDVVLLQEVGKVPADPWSDDGCMEEDVALLAAAGMAGSVSRCVLCVCRGALHTPAMLAPLARLPALTSLVLCGGGAIERPGLLALCDLLTKLPGLQQVTLPAGADLAGAAAASLGAAAAERLAGLSVRYAR